MNTEVLIIGGGFAGISAAITLCDAGKKVLIVEKKRVLGGRAFSYQDTETEETLDNGQHLLMACYHHTLDLLKKINTDHKLYCQPSLKVEFIDADQKITQFSTPPNSGAFGIMKAFLKADFLTFAEKIQTVLSLALFLKKMKQPGQTVQKWLERAKQPAQTQTYFWEPLCLAALNASPQRAASELLYRVIEEAYLKHKGSDGLIFPLAGLSELTGKAAIAYIEKKSGSVLTTQSVKKIEIKKGAVFSVELVNGEIILPKAVVSALPPSALLKLISPQALGLEETHFEKCVSSPILSIHLWLGKPLTRKPFLGMIHSPLHWIFNRQGLWNLPEKSPYLYSLIASEAHEWISKSTEQIKAMVYQELVRYFPLFHPAQVLRIKIIKELEATLSPSPDVLPYRLETKTKIRNFFLAGDWIQTGLPATLESAVLSGKLAANSYLKTQNKEHS